MIARRGCGARTAETAASTAWMSLPTPPDALPSAPTLGTWFEALGFTVTTLAPADLDASCPKRKATSDAPSATSVAAAAVASVFSFPSPRRMAVSSARRAIFSAASSC